MAIPSLIKLVRRPPVTKVLVPSLAASWTGRTAAKMSSAPKVPGAAIYTRSGGCMAASAPAELRQHFQNLLRSSLLQAGVAHSGIL